MAEDFFSGLSKANFYGQDPNSPEQQEILDAVKAGQQALETRYAQPNWFNIAAGFAKPQLGGFTASLGSAAEAMGATEENRRKDVLTAAQYRAQVALMKNQMGQNQAANKLVSEHTGPITYDLLQKAVRLAPDAPATKSLQAGYEGQQKERGLASSEQSNAIARITLARSMGTAPNPEDLALVAAKSPTAPKKDVEAPVVAAPKIATPKIEAPAEVAPATLAPSTNAKAPIGTFNFEQTTLPSIERSISAIPDETDRKKAKEALDTQLAALPKKVIASQFNMESGLTPDQLAKVVKPSEDIAEARYAGLMIGAPEQYTPRARVLDSQIDLIKNNSKPDKPDGTSPVQRVTSVLSQGKIFDGILAALNEGIGVSVNGLSANLRAPIETYIRANFDKKDQDLAMAMANNYASIALMQQQIGKVNPNSARNAELGLYNSLTPSMNTTPNAAMRSLLHLKHDLDMTRSQYEHVTSILNNKHPTLKLKPDELARFSVAFDPQYLEKINEPYAEKHRKVEDAFQRSLGTK